MKYPLWTTAVLLIITLSAEAQLKDYASLPNATQKDELNEPNYKSFSPDPLTKDSLRLKVMGKQFSTLKNHSSLITLFPDNMLVYIPENKNPDNMPFIRQDYPKSNIKDNIPNSYKRKTPDTAAVKLMKPDNKLSK